MRGRIEPGRDNFSVRCLGGTNEQGPDQKSQSIG